MKLAKMLDITRFSPKRGGGKGTSKLRRQIHLHQSRRR